MKFINTLIALVLVAALGGVLFYLNKHPKEMPSDSAVPKKKLFSFQADQVKSFSIEAPGQTATTIRKTGDQKWEVTSPAGVPANNSLIQSFVDGLPKMEYTPVDSETPSSLADYGLDRPQKTLKFELTSGQPLTLLIGGDNPGGYAKYAMFSSTPGLFLLDSLDTKDLVDKTLFDLRDKRVLPVAVDKAKQVQLKFEFTPASAAELERAKKLGLSVKPPKIGFTRQPNNNWEVTDPAVRTDYGNTNYFVTILNGGIMKSVEAENAKSLGAYGLDRPAIRADVTAEDGSAHSLLIGRKKEAKPGDNKEGESKSDENLGYYAKNSDSPAIFTINQSVYDQLNQDLDNYRNRFLFDFENANARRIEIQGPTGDLRFDRKGEDWFKADGKTKADASKISALLDEIHSMRVQHYTEDKPGHFAEYGLDKPWLNVKITFGEQNKEETVIFGQKNKKFYAARQDSPSVYEMPASAPESLQTKLKELSS
ncbi:MAG: DUF4340 domain-containing protein [Acidobacteria bacterium]|nr:DUF4340 domain-containing protein [Acidobacteriota bacterium]